MWSGQRSARCTNHEAEVTVSTDQGAKEEITTDPQKIDKALQNIWGKIFFLALLASKADPRSVQPTSLGLTSILFLH